MAEVADQPNEIISKKKHFLLIRTCVILEDPRAVSGGGKKFKSKLAEDFFSPVLDFFPPPPTAPGSARMNQYLLGFVCRSINLPIFTEISRFFCISLQIFGVLRLRGLLLSYSNIHKSLGELEKVVETYLHAFSYHGMHWAGQVKEGTVIPTV